MQKSTLASLQASVLASLLEAVVVPVLVSLLEAVLASLQVVSLVVVVRLVLLVMPVFWGRPACGGAAGRSPGHDAAGVAGLAGVPESGAIAVEP